MNWKQMNPTEKQLVAIAFIERSLPYLKFVGMTKGEASEFIALHLERSKKQNRIVKQSRSTFHTNTQLCKTTKDTDEECYNEFIDSVCQNYLDDCSDSYGWSSEHKDIARRLHPFEEWKRNIR